ncbi:GTP cyclohydrolase II [Vulgatibacter incomptus]|uniref:GTP cyclohydrolase-2 n=1 Tax=Vulgatibacter incomptus TaxID=1391653 RepID=A0A0K1PFD0_9BACT|nr:GTP cyclohydrolase II [Vulgatibacter incomptus]AKU92215.1 3,4-dihydroxy-2-butanone 4-phosphate synthase [Vulgatibacter incomptus]
MVQPPDDGLRMVALARADLPTEHGTFEAIVFSMAGDPREHVALVFGKPEAQERVAVRVHSECLTGEAFASLKCDCGAQLDGAMREVARRGVGVVLYLRQEGRGIGLANKIRAYALQAQGADTVDANRLLGLPDDARTYEAAAAMVEFLGIRSIELITNNPAKVDAMSTLGVRVEARIPSLVPVGEHARRYLEVKRDRMHHLIPEQRQAVPQSVAHGTNSGSSKR